MSADALTEYNAAVCASTACRVGVASLYFDIQGIRVEVIKFRPAWPLAATNNHPVKNLSW